MIGRGRPPEGAVHEVRIPDELWDELAFESKQTGQPIARLLREIIREHYGTPEVTT